MSLEITKCSILFYLEFILRHESEVGEHLGEEVPLRIVRYALMRLLQAFRATEMAEAGGIDELLVFESALRLQFSPPP